MESSQARLEADTHSFIVKIWREEIDEATEVAIWRGHVTHVPSGERRYLQDLDDLVTFIIPYLEKMEVKAAGAIKVAGATKLTFFWQSRWGYQVRQWLKRLDLFQKFK